MKTTRKIQLGATSVICAAILAMNTFLSPDAIASNCSPESTCFANNGYTICERMTTAQRLQTCNAIPHTAGCTASSAVCEYSLSGCASGGMVCYYQ